MEHSPRTFKPHEVLYRYAQVTKQYPVYFAIALLGTLGMQAAHLISPLFMKELVNIIAASTPDPVVVHRLLVITSIVSVFLFLGWVFRRMQVYGIMRLEIRAMSDLHMQAFEYLMGHSYHFFSNQFAGTLTRRVGRYAESYETLLDALVLTLVPTVIFIVGAVGILYTRHPALGIALGVWALGFVWAQVVLSRHHKPLRRASVEADSKRAGVLADAIGNQYSITLFSGRAYEQTHFGEAVKHAEQAEWRNWQANDRVWSVQGGLMVGINIVLLFGAFYLWTRGQLTVGDFLLLQMYIMGTFDQLWNMSRLFRRFDGAYTAATEMVDILNTPHEVADIPGARPLTVSRGKIEFKDVTFYFDETKPIFERFDMTIRGGQKVALVGSSGAGKSTITKLLLRLFDVKSGAVMIDGQDVAQVTQDSLRDAIAFVPQEPILFHRSLMENIRYGKRDATDEEVIAAARQAHCHEFIEALPQGYETFVGERGVKLSGGERQRVAVARAILKNAPILVLDEATSSLDSESEALIQDALETLMQGKTVVAIAHRLSTIMKMDRILVIEGGRIADDGTHTELLERGGLYQKLWSIQAGGFLQDVDKE